ncbi:MAG TPA: exodeoxyribonuclease VII large subunit [Chloroflexota bacterium]|nr:exodeoxyribonuclease VII large subunit [Chloroflexota bacterium]
MSLRILKVEQVSRFLRELFDANPVLQDLWVQGQISNVTRSGQGHWYFTLKERDSQLNCVLFRQALEPQPVAPVNGMAAIVHGRISVYESRGVYQLVADLIQPEGIGKLHLQLEQLKARLGHEGLFDARRKRPLPRWPRRIGVVTSPSGAVFHDIVNVVRRKYPACEILLAAALVQGEQAAPSVAAALNALDQSGLVDVAIVARGGGSLEELWPFNDERVARAIFAARMPVISAVGHETDVTVADLVADVRAPTPSVAADLAVPDLAAELRHIRELAARMEALAMAAVAERRQRLADQARALERNSPTAQLGHNRERLASLERTLQHSTRHALELRGERLLTLQAQLNLMNPYATLERGYSITYSGSGHVIASIRDLAPPEPVEVQLSDGRFTATPLPLGPRLRHEARPAGPPAVSQARGR